MPADIAQLGLAAKAFYPVILNTLRNDKGVHAETAVAASARMAGTFLLRACQLPIAALTPGSAVLSDAANERGPALIERLGKILEAMDIPIDTARANEAQPNATPPQLTILRMQEMLDAPLSAIARQHGLDDDDAAHAAAFCTAMFVRDCASVLDPTVAFGIAVYGFIEGAKTVPYRGAATLPAKPWYKIW